MIDESFVPQTKEYLLYKEYSSAFKKLAEEGILIQIQEPKHTHINIGGWEYGAIISRYEVPGLKSWYMEFELVDVTEWTLFWRKSGERLSYDLEHVLESEEFKETSDTGKNILLFNFNLFKKRLNGRLYSSVSLFGWEK